MELRRKAYQQLVKWKQRENHKPLIVEGLRQVGKSYLVDRFAKENYENVVVFDFRYNQKTRGFFQDDLSVDSILQKAYVYFPAELFVPGKTVLVFEEIGDCGQARASLKSFALDGRFDVIGTGSLLGVANYRKRKKEPIPTGYEEYLEMSSLDFEEFLWAIGATEAFIAELKKHVESFAPLSQPFIEYGKSAIKAYMIVGGMPEAVINYIESGGDFMAARNKLLSLNRDYETDFGRYVDEDGVEKIDFILKGRLTSLWRSIPAQLARENGNSKFRYNDVPGRGRKEDLALPIEWLLEAGMIIKGRNTIVPESPLPSNAKEDEFKLFVADPGLLSALYEPSLIQESLQGILGAKKGALTENLIATFLSKAGFGTYYFADSLKHKEIDFVVEADDGIVLIEAKSTNGQVKASKDLVSGQRPYQRYTCIKAIENDFGTGSFYKSVPHYALPFFLNSISERGKLPIGLPKCPD